MVTALTPAGLHHIFCREASGAGPSYVTKFRCQHQMDLLGQIPERKTLHATPSPTQSLPSQTLALCYRADQVPRATQSQPSSQSQTIGCIQLDLPLCLTARWKGVRATGF